MHSIIRNGAARDNAGAPVYHSFMEIARIGQLLQPFFEDEKPSDSLLQIVARYLDLLLKWNAKMNLTAVRDPEHIVRRHFGESFFAARKLAGREESPQVIDIGSGPGFPGVPIKMLRPKAEVRLVEAQAKKASFLREVVRELALQGISVVNERAEAMTGKCDADLVTFRAVERFESVLPVAASLLSEKGKLAVLIGEDQLALARKVLPGRWEEFARIPLSTSRLLATWMHQLPEPAE